MDQPDPDAPKFYLVYSLVKARSREEAIEIAKEQLNADYIEKDDGDIIDNLAEDDLVNACILGIKEMKVVEKD